MRSFGGRLLAAGLVIALILLFGALHWLDPLEDLALRIVAPVSRVFYSLKVSVKERAGFLRSRSTLEKERNSLETDNRRLRLQSVETEGLKAENAELRSLLQFTKRTNQKIIPAEIVGRTIAGAANTFMINIGENDGVRLHAPVVAMDGLLVGSIDSTTAGSSFVRLLSDPQSKVSATILPRTYALGVLEGGFGLSQRLELVPQNEEIKEGDLVVTAGLEPGMPKGLLIGEIEAVIKEPFAPFQHAAVTPAVTIDRLRTVAVIINE